MPRNTDGSPSAPKVDFLEKAVERFDALINNGHSLAIVGTDEKDPLAVAEVVEIIEEPIVVAYRDAFEWLATFLGNRRDYHKRRQTKQKIELQLMEEALSRHGVDVKKIQKEADRAADDSIL